MAAASSTGKLSQLIISEGRCVKLPKGEVIQSTDTANNLCLIKNGCVKKYLILNDGNIRVQIIYGPSDIFPLTVAYKALLEQPLYAGPETYYYETIIESEIYLLDKERLAELVTADRMLYKELFSEAGRRLYFNIHMLENLGLPNSYKRVAHQIAFLAREFGQKKIFGTKLQVPFTQQDLADILSITRETVSLCMNQLKKQKLIRTGRYIIVLDIKKLEAEAYT